MWFYIIPSAAPPNSNLRRCAGPFIKYVLNSSEDNMYARPDIVVQNEHVKPEKAKKSALKSWEEKLTESCHAISTVKYASMI